MLLVCTPCTAAPTREAAYPSKCSAAVDSLAFPLIPLWVAWATGVPRLESLSTVIKTCSRDILKRKRLKPSPHHLPVSFRAIVDTLSLSFVLQIGRVGRETTQPPRESRMGAGRAQRSPCPSLVQFCTSHVPLCTSNVLVLSRGCMSHAPVVSSVCTSHALLVLKRDPMRDLQEEVL